MNTFSSLVWAGCLLFCLGCVTEPEYTEPPSEPEYRPDEYGGSMLLPGTEHLTTISPSPDGSKIALIRQIPQTPEFEPREQVWVMNADGSNPQMVAYGAIGLNWHPDGNTLALTHAPWPRAYVFTLDLTTREVRVWTGKEEHYFDKAVEFVTGWRAEGYVLQVSVAAKAYQQEYERGLYYLDTSDSTHIGPVKTLFNSFQIGNNDRWVVGIYWDDPVNAGLGGNAAMLDLQTNKLHYLTRFNRFKSDSITYHLGIPALHPHGEEMVVPIRKQNVWQIFLVDKDARRLAQLTTRGGDEITWSRGSEYFTFNRDTHKGIGARYIPFKYYLRERREEALWPHLPDSVPVFPPISTQNPVNLSEYIR